MTAKILCLLVVVFDCCGLYFSFRRSKWQILTFYTQLSNIAASLSALLFVLAGPGDFVSAFRFTANIMLIMTFLVVVFVLIPMGAPPKIMLFTSSGLFHHLLVPIISNISYIFFESHARPVTIVAPIAVTLIYGVIMMYLNWVGKVDGPYPFLRIRQQSKGKTVFWIISMTALIGCIGFGLWAVAR